MLLGILLLVGFIGIVLYFTRNAEGCGGDCYQGRRPCDCKGKK